MRPFMSSMSGVVPSGDHSASPPPKVDWSKVTDPRQSIKILDSLEPEAVDQAFDELEILGGSTKSGGAMHFKYKTEQAILDNIGVSPKNLKSIVAQASCPREDQDQGALPSASVD